MRPSIQQEIEKKIRRHGIVAVCDPSEMVVITYRGASRSFWIGLLTGEALLTFLDGVDEGLDVLGFVKKPVPKR